MQIRELRLNTGLSQSKFAGLFDIPVSTLKDWEQERRNPPAYIITMMKKILEYEGLLENISYADECDKRRKHVENALAITLSATDGPDDIFMEALDSYVSGMTTLEELESRVDRLEFLGV